MANKHKVEFDAHKKVKKEVDVSFRKKDGEKVSFEAHKTVKEPVHVRFRAKNKSR
jgi:hypothetical protein